jgi:hypothetical protein
MQLFNAKFKGKQWDWELLAEKVFYRLIEFFVIQSTPEISWNHKLVSLRFY